MLEMAEQQRKIFDEFRKNPHAYPEEAKMSDARLLKRVEELTEEMSYLITFRDDSNPDLVIQTEALLLLSGRNSLTGFYAQLKFLHHFNLLQILSQVELSEMLGLSSATYTRYKKALMKLELIGEFRQGHTKLIQFRPIKRLAYIPTFKDPKSYLNWLKKIRPKIEVMTPEKLVHYALMEENKQFQLQLDGIVDDKVKEIAKKEREIKKKLEPTFPNEDYEIVIAAFRKYKRVGLVGPEVVRAKHAIKQMFLAQRTPKQIVDCIIFFSEHQNEEDYRWLHSWTLETVMKKMPEFMAGQLRTRRMGDDIKEV